MSVEKKLTIYVLLGVGMQWVSEPMFASLPPWAQALSRCILAGLLILKAYTSDPNGPAPAPIPPTQKPAPTP